jgi:hypothetical protein
MKPRLVQEKLSLQIRQYVFGYVEGSGAETKNLSVISGSLQLILDPVVSLFIIVREFIILL